MKKIQNLVRGSDIARAAGISNQAIWSAMQRGNLEKLPGTSMYDLTNPVNLGWLKDHDLKPADIKPGMRYHYPSTLSEALEEADLKKRGAYNKMRLAEVRLKNMEKKYIPWDFIKTVVEDYLDTLEKNILAISKKEIPKIGQKILTEKEITPAIIEEFTNFTLAVIHKTKLAKMKKFENGPTTHEEDPKKLQSTNRPGAGTK